MPGLDERVMNEIEYKTFIKIINNIPSCIFFKDTDLKYRFSSHFWMQLTNNDIVGKTDFEVRKDKDNALKAMQADRQIIATKKGQTYVIKSDIDGVVTYLELIKEPIFDDDGEVIGIVGLINDITKMKELEHQLRSMSKELEVKCEELEKTNSELLQALELVEHMNKAQKLFTASVNHELRTPLNGIIGMLQILLEEGNLSELQEGYIGNAYRSSKILLELVNDLLDLAKMETNEFKIRYDKFDIRDLLSDINSMAENRAEAKNIKFRLEIDDAVYCKIISDEIRVRQILFNLVSNGIKYTAEGEVVLRVEYKEGQVIFTCSDTGQGIPEEAMKVLFDPYVRLNEAQNVGIQGTGLGLSIVKKLVDRMKGEISVESTVNVGTTFTVKLPVEVCDDTVYKSEDEKKAVVADEIPDFSKLTVLCVDDTEINMLIFSKLLKNTGIKVDKANSGLKALELASVNKYDIIFTDHLMPEMDGLETFEHLKNDDGPNKKTPVVVMTANSGEEYEEQYRNLGFVGYLVKPFMKYDLFSMISDISSKYN